MSDKEKDLNIERAAIFTDNALTGDLDAISCEGARKLATRDWEAAIEGGVNRGDIFEIRFKNTRKGYYQNGNNLPLKIGDIVAVESSPGHDIGIVSLMGDMVRKQMRCKGFDSTGVEFKKIYRIAKGTDIVKWQEAIQLEYPTMIMARRYAQSLGLNMKIGDVEFQGDKVKAIFYYIADARVDFRELIRVFAEEFKVRIEMKQIGARQEAGRIGGIGSCGRELCCSTWVTNFVSVTTNSARFQEISLNPQKLAGQCGKLKCCLNYEVDSYIDARKGFPKVYAPLETIDATYHLVKSDILRGEMVFSSDPHSMVNVVSVPIERVREIIHQNKKGVKVDKLLVASNDVFVEVKHDYMNVVGDDSITRFDKGAEEGGNRQRRNRNKNRNGGNGSKPQQQNGEQQIQKQPENKEPRQPKVSREQREPRENNNKQKAIGTIVEMVKDKQQNKDVAKVSAEGEEQQPKEKSNRPRRRWNNKRGGNGGNNNSGNKGSAE
ncbi:MAG: regulatory iron-sulfur-containing complex subunit RicT [Rikenellaceae bacterium]